MQKPPAAAMVAMLALAAPAPAVAFWNELKPALSSPEEMKQRRLFCSKNPNDSACRETSAALLLIDCASSDQLDNARCGGRLDAMAFDGRALPEWSCAPKDMHPEQLRLLFVREAHRLPEMLHQPARTFLFYAVAKAFPCASNPLLRARP